MATLAATFLADLEDLEEEEEEREEGEEVGNEVRQNGEEHADGENLHRPSTSGCGPAGAGGGGVAMAGLRELAPLTSTPRYASVIERVRGAEPMSVEGSGSGEAVGDGDNSLGSFIVDCNGLVADMDGEVHKVHGYLRDHYRRRFPELESLVLHPVDYARVVQRLITSGKEGVALEEDEDITEVNLEGLLPSATIMVVTVTASTTSGERISPEEKRRCLDGCDMIMTIDEDRRCVQGYVEGKMELIAPNMSRAVGSVTAAQLMCAAGGLVALSRIPSCNIQVLGSKRKTLAGYSTSTSQVFRGFIAECPIVAATPPSLQQKAIRLVGAKCALLARVDAYGQDPSGGAGQKMRDEMEKKIEKWQEPPPARMEKPLPVPDLESKKRRGGRRLRKMKERYGLTDAQKAQNRLGFDFKNGEEALEVDDEVMGLGSIGQVGSGVSNGSLRMRLGSSAGDAGKSKYAAKAAKKMKTSGGGLMSQAGGLAGAFSRQGGGAVGGLASSLAFTPVQGIELQNPNQAMESDAGSDGTKTYFSSMSTFSKISRTR